MKNELPLDISVVRTLDDLHRAYSVRDIVFLDHQSCPYPEEFDGNDLCATHLLASVNARPAGTLRIRYFAAFAKFERVAVLPQYRGNAVARQLVEEAVRLIQIKGYQRFVLHAQKRYETFWARWAHRDLSQAPFTFSDHDYIAMIGEVPQVSTALSESTSPMVLNRPEGEWDEPGILDQSVHRAPIMNPGAMEAVR